MTDSQAAIVAIKKAGKIGKARTGELKRVMKRIKEGKKILGPKAVSLEWVKSHAGIKDNEESDKKAKLSVKEEDPAFLLITEGGL